MTSRDFCYWLQGYFELMVEFTRQGDNALAPSLNQHQVDCVRKHLAMVFHHEIDPSFGKDNPALSAIHHGGVAPTTDPKLQSGLEKALSSSIADGVKPRC